MYNFFMQEVNFDVIIIGSGPSGLTSAIYTSRALLKTLVIGGNPPGGQLTITSDVENFPGFPEGIKGQALIQKLRAQAEKFDTKFTDENVTSISGSFDNSFTLQTDSKKIYTSRAVIVATGASARWLNLENEQRLRGKGVSACATCDGFFFKDKIVAVVGGGDAAMEEANYLAMFAKKVYILVRGDRKKMRASRIMQERAFKNPKIEFIFNTLVIDVLGKNHVEGLRIANRISGEDSELSNVEGLFIAVGHEPNTKFLSGFVDLDEKGYVKLYNGTKSSKEGVFVAGDVADYKYRQAITAAGYGCMAALDTIKFFSEHGVKTENPGYQ
jgi:thioredoxin reductase (NADPH)